MVEGLTEAPQVPDREFALDGCRAAGQPSAMFQSRKAPMDRSWRKSRIAARILRRGQIGAVSDRDRRLARQLAEDPGVTSRLIHQALHGLSSRESRLGIGRRPVD